MHRHIAFGLRWDSDIPLDQFAAAPDDDVTPADIVVRRAPGPFPEREAIRSMDGASLCADGIRFNATDEAFFDLYAPGRINWLPGPNWTGRLPMQFFGTLTALLLAWRGSAPIHGSSVEIDGGAYLICGESGAGKSTLSAALIAHAGARLIADDLTVLSPGTAGVPILYPGRPAIRLFPDLAECMIESGSEIREDPSNDKHLVYPPRVESLTPVPLAAVILIGAALEEMSAWEREVYIDTQVFRPSWMRAIPGWQQRFQMLHRAGTIVPMLTFERADIRDAKAFQARAAYAMSRLQHSNAKFRDAGTS